MFVSNIDSRGFFVVSCQGEYGAKLSQLMGEWEESRRKKGGSKLSKGGMQVRQRRLSSLIGQRRIYKHNY
jgi:hypothetical protein